MPPITAVRTRITQYDSGAQLSARFPCPAGGVAAAAFAGASP